VIFEASGEAVIAALFSTDQTVEHINDHHKHKGKQTGFVITFGDLFCTTRVNVSVNLLNAPFCIRTTRAKAGFPTAHGD
jgi:hypothetical protein